MDFPPVEDRVFCNDAPADADLFLSMRFARRSEETFFENMLTAGVLQQLRYYLITWNIKHDIVLITII